MQNDPYSYFEHVETFEDNVEALVNADKDLQSEREKNDQLSILAYRAALLLAGTNSEIAISTMCSALHSRIVPDAFKSLVIHALAGISEEKHVNQIAVTLGLVLSDLRSSDTLRHQVLEHWSIYRPRCELIHTIIKEAQKPTRQGITSTDVQRNGAAGNAWRTFEAPTIRAGSPRFSFDEAEQARTYLSAEIWRPIAHLKDLDSIIIPGRQPGILHEILPAGARGDLISFELIRLT